MNGYEEINLFNYQHQPVYKRLWVVKGYNHIKGEVFDELACIEYKVADEFESGEYGDADSCRKDYYRAKSHDSNGYELFPKTRCFDELYQAYHYANTHQEDLKFTGRIIPLNK